MISGSNSSHHRLFLMDCENSGVSPQYFMIKLFRGDINTKKYHVFAPMGRFQLESIYLNFPPSSQDRNIYIIAGTMVENKGKLILTKIFKFTSI